MKVITVANQKGGIGKTTTATTVASILNKEGRKVLIIDTDMQCNSTDMYRVETDGVATIYDLIVSDEKVNIKDAIQHTDAGDIIASDRLLIEADDKLKSDSEGIYRLQDAISELKGYDYDYVIIDTNPTLNYLLYNCLVASDYLIIPVTADRFGFMGLKQLSQTVAKIKKRQNEKLKVLGLLLVKYKEKTNLGRELKEVLSEAAIEMDTTLFDTFIRESVKVQESQALRIPLMEHAPNCTSSLDYKAFVEEMMARI